MANTTNFDGEIRINTAIEADGFEAGSKEIEAAARRMSQSVSKIGDTAKIALQKQTDAFIKQNQMYANQERKVEALRNKYQELSAQKVETDEFKEIGLQIDKDTAKLNQLERAQERFLETGGKTNSSAYKKRELDIEELRNSIRYAKAEQDDLLKSGNAYKAADTSGISQKLNSEQQKLNQMSASLGTSWQSLKAKVVSCNGSLNKTVSLKNQLKNAFGVIGDSIKRTGKRVVELDGKTKKTNRSLLRMIGTSLMMGMAFKAVMAIMNGIKEGMDNLAQYSDDTNADLSALKSSLTQLKNSFATAFAPILSVVTPILTSFMNTISEVVNKIGMLMAALTGKETYTKAVAVQEDYAAGLKDAANSAKEASKAQKDYTTSLDEINKVNPETPTSSSGKADISDMFEEVEIPNSFQSLAGKIDGIFSPIINKFKDFGKRISEVTSEWWKGLDFVPLQTSFNGMMESISPFIELSLNGLLWVYENVLLPLATWTIEQATPALINLLAGAFDLLCSVLEALSPLANWLWNNFLQPISEWTGGVIVNVINWLADALTCVSDWISEHQGLVETFTIIVGSFAAAWGLVNGALTLWNIIVGIWSNIGVIATAVTTAFGAAVNFLASPITLIILAIGALIAIVVLLVRNWDTVKEVASNVWEGIKSVWSKVSNWFKEKVLNPLSNGFKGMVNGVIGFLNGMIRGIVSGINTVFRAVNKISVKIPDWIPGIGGKSIGFNFPTFTAPQIPYLATGAVIPPNAPFMAMLGDQKRGMNIEAPEDLLRKIVREETSGQRANGGTFKFVGQINRRTLFEELIEEAKLFQMNNGKNPFDLA